MAGRRRFGRIRKLPSGRFQARYLGPDGREHTAPDTFATKTDAAKTLDRIEGDLHRGGWTDPRRARESLKSYAEQWIEHRPGLKPRTAELYRALLRLHIEPRLGKTALGELSPSQVRAWHAGLVAAGEGSTTPAKAYRLLRAVCNTAVADELILRNPCQVRGAGQEHSPERQPPTTAEVSALADAIEDRYRLLILLAAWATLRWGEAAGLRRRDFDLLHGTVTIDEQLVQMDGGVLSLGKPKTAAGVRTIAIPPHLLPDVEAHLNAFVPSGPDAWVFLGPQGAMLRRSNFGTVLRRAKTKAGVRDFTFHDLRHHAATLAAGIPGVTTRDLMARMGHSSARAALLYQHAAAGRDTLLAASLSDLARASASGAGHPA
jgi:integrase